MEPAVAGFGMRTLYDGSGRLAAQVRLGTPVDLFLAADRSFLHGLGLEVRPLRKQRLRCVRSASGRDVSWPDLLSGVHRVSIASPDAAAAGRVLRRAAGGDYERLRAAAFERASVTEVAADVAALGAADFGFVWDTTWPRDGRLVEVPMPEIAAAAGEVALGVRPGGGLGAEAAAVAAAVRAA